MFTIICDFANNVFIRNKFIITSILQLFYFQSLKLYCPRVLTNLQVAATHNYQNPCLWLKAFSQAQAQVAPQDSPWQSLPIIDLDLPKILQVLSSTRQQQQNYPYPQTSWIVWLAASLNFNFKFTAIESITFEHSIPNKISAMSNPLSSTYFFSIKFCSHQIKFSFIPSSQSLIPRMS